jgi:hypothetical protein
MPSSCLSGAHVQPYIDLMECLNTWQAQDYVSSSKTAEHFNRPHGIAQSCKHGRYDRRIILATQISDGEKNAGEK